MSTTTLLGSLGALALVGLRKAKLPADHPAKRFGQPLLTAGLFPMGILQLMTAVAYTLSLVQGDRPGPLPIHLAFLLLGGVSGFNNFAQIGRKVPWAVLAGGGVGALGGAGIYTLASDIQGASWAVLGGSGFIALVLFYAIFFLLLPVSDFIQTLGNVTAFSPVMIGLQVPTAILAILAAMQVVVL